MSDAPQVTPAEDVVEPPVALTERERLEKVYHDLQKCILVTAAKSDVDRLTFVCNDLKDVLFPPEPPPEPEPEPYVVPESEAPPERDRRFDPRRRGV